MNNIEINKYFYKFKNYFGFYPRDLLPAAIPLDCGFIINTDDSRKPGEHWVSIYLAKNGIAEYFDSFGLPPLHKDIINFLDRISPIGWYHNLIVFQNFYTDTCGMYCVFYLANRFNGGDFNLFKSLFNYKPHLNDRLAKLLYKALK